MTRPIQREHLLQRKIKEFVRDAVDGPCQFMAFDSAKKATPWARAREAARGIAKGTPDTSIKVPGLPTIWVELKAPGNKPSADQLEMAVRLQAVGDLWFWCNSVQSYAEGLLRFGVRLRDNWLFQSQHHDAFVASCIARAEAKRAAPAKRVASAPRAVKPTPAAIKRVNAVRARVRF